MASAKPVHTLVLDTGAIIKNEPPLSTLLAKAEQLVTAPAIMSEIKDAATRSRMETTLQPWLSIRTPSLASVRFVTDFARRTGDLAVLSKPDIQIIALTYEIECERNSGDWRLRKVPGQKGLNGAPPAKIATETKDRAADDGTEQSVKEARQQENGYEATIATDATADQEVQDQAVESKSYEPELAQQIASLSIDAATKPMEEPQRPPVDSAQNSGASQEDSGSDSDGWITPANLKKRQTQDAGASTVQTREPKTMQVGVLTTDFAMQNVILQINLNLLSPSMTSVKHLKTFVLRCHACFQTTKDMSKQFCPNCGQPTLTRVSCSTDANGQFKLHLKKNMQWNTRGDRYSIPKAVHGSANGRIKGGGKGGWGNELILAEDQKEYERASKLEKRRKERSLMDEDDLPSILTGDRARVGGKIKVGAGRSVNARKR